jgi:hypothetical protein
LTLKPEQVNAFLRLMGQRYGRVSTILTTNLDYPDWYTLFDNKALVDALLDRLQHRCITIRINGPSLRDPRSLPRRRSTPPRRTRPPSKTKNNASRAHSSSVTSQRCRSGIETRLLVVADAFDSPRYTTSAHSPGQFLMSIHGSVFVSAEGCLANGFLPAN